MNDNPLLPQLCRLINIERETPDILTLRVAAQFSCLPGQTAMLSLPGVGEGMFSVSAVGDQWLEFSVKKVGLLTEALHELTVGQQIGLRGPYGNHFPLDEARGRDLLFIGGGIGLTPLRYAIAYALARRRDYGRITVIAGARKAVELPFSKEMRETWPNAQIVVDEDGMGPLPAYLARCALNGENTAALLCGPTAMLRPTLDVLAARGFEPERVFVSLERRMQCGLGICGRCRIGTVHVCVDGPVFSAAQLAMLPVAYDG